MKRFAELITASAVAAVLATPLVFAQQTDSTTRKGDAAQTQPGHPSTGSSSMGKSGDSMSQSGTSSGADQYGVETIREVQQALKDKGIDTGPVDGIMGPQTKAALKEFQQKEGLSGSGQLNHQTLAALNVNESGAMGSGSRSGSGSGTSAGRAESSSSGQGSSADRSSSSTPGSSASGSTAPGSTDAATTKRP